MDYTVRLDTGMGELMLVPNVVSHYVIEDEGYVMFNHENGETTTIMLKFVVSITPEDTKKKEPYSRSMGLRSMT